MAQKILIIEDEEILSNLLQKKLVQEGYDVVAACDGEEGLETIRKENPDLILLDIVMPKMSGLEVMENMTKDKTLKKIPVIVISNSGQPVELDKAQRLGASDWLIKTDFDPAEVVAKVKKLLPAGS